MRKSYKERTLEACEQLAIKYREDRDGPFFTSKSCPLCHIYRKCLQDNVVSCRGCFMADEFGGVECMEFRTFMEAEAAQDEGDDYSEEFEYRAQFFDEMLKELQEYPDRKFTPSGWSYFDIDLDR